MDLITLMTTLDFVRGIPDSAISRCEAAQEAAETAAAGAAKHNYTVTIVDDVEYITDANEEEGE